MLCSDFIMFCYASKLYSAGISSSSFISCLLILNDNINDTRGLKCKAFELSDGNKTPQFPRLIIHIIKLDFGTVFFLQPCQKINYTVIKVCQTTYPVTEIF